MSFINYAKKEIGFKLVYYGPGVCGKTTNLEQIHKALPGTSKGDLTMLATKQDRTLFFDFLPLKSDVIKGYTAKFQLYTVPGQVIYNATRKMVLARVDGIVFVADSQFDKMAENAESFANLAENLEAQKMSIDEIPYVLQYNKRDLPGIAPRHYMDFMLNNRARKADVFEAEAVNGTGVFETLNAAAKHVLAKFIADNNMPVAGDDMAGDVAV